jgi:hypothetical protein
LRWIPRWFEMRAAQIRNDTSLTVHRRWNRCDNYQSCSCADNFNVRTATCTSEGSTNHWLNASMNKGVECVRNALVSILRSGCRLMLRVGILIVEDEAGQAMDAANDGWGAACCEGCKPHTAGTSTVLVLVHVLY